MARRASLIREEDRAWHLDRRFPIALIVTLIITIGSQTWVASWWASKTDSRIEVLEKASAASAPLTATQGDRLTRVEVKLDNLADGLQEIKSILRKEPLPVVTKKP
jgi:hypothetical protein